MAWYRGAFALFVALFGSGCLEDTGLATSGGCPPGGSCHGADDCYASCFCETGGAAQCERECGAARGLRVQDLDESEWTAAWSAFEDEVVLLTNAARAEGGCCGDEGCFAATPALSPDTRLRRSARAHALDMGARDYFAHDSPEGRSPFDRMREAGFRGCAMGENIAAGQSTPELVIESWLESPGHCVNMLSPGFDRIGVSYRPASDQSSSHVWVQNFGG